MKRILNSLKHLYKTSKVETIMVVASILLGLSGAALEQSSRKSFETKVKGQYKVEPIMVASSNLKEGTILSKEHLTSRPFLAANRTPSMVPPKESQLVLGQSLKADLVKGDPILLSNLDSDQDLRTIAERIPPGKRLFMLQIKDRVAQNGFIRPGDYVDILARISFPGRGLTSFTLLSNMQIVSMGKSINPLDRTVSNQVSFFVLPEQMEILNFAEGQGEFRLSLRNPHDKKISASKKGVDREVFLNSDLLYEVSDLPVTVTEGHQSEDKKGR